MKFVFGAICGVVGMWAYQNGKIQDMMSGAPQPVQQAWNTGTQQVGRVANNERVQQMTSSLQDRIGQAGGGATETSEIAMPSASEVAGRPAEPLPGQEG